MKYAVGGGGWMVRDWLIPSGTVIDDSLPQWQWLFQIPGYDLSLNPTRRLGPPPDAAPLNQETYDYMTQVLGYQYVKSPFAPVAPAPVAMPPQIPAVPLVPTGIPTLRYQVSGPGGGQLGVAPVVKQTIGPNIDYWGRPCPWTE